MGHIPYSSAKRLYIAIAELCRREVDEEIKHIPDNRNI